MKSGFDINKINGDGYLIIPLSMSNLAGKQNPKECYKVLEYFFKKLETYSNDVILLYTNGLYFNSEEISFEKRKKTNEQMINHSLEIRRLIENKKQFMPRAFHFLPMDYVILNSPQFTQFFKILKKLELSDTKFKECILIDLNGRKYIEANINFILEELAIAHILRQQLVELPKTLVHSDMWRLIVYPGKYLESDLYQWKNKILPQNKCKNIFSGSQYDFHQKKIFSFDESQ